MVLDSTILKAEYAPPLLTRLAAASLLLAALARPADRGDFNWGCSSRHRLAE
jgi:hypothetical protein